MDIRELRYFLAAYEERSLTSGARRCFVSQPSISAAVVNLEQELKATLFVRSKKGVVPTPAADMLYPLAKRMADDVDAIRKLFQEQPPCASLTLGLMRTLDVRRVLELLGSAAVDPGLHLRLVAADETSDARIISTVLIKEDETFLPLWTERYVLALPPKHNLAQKQSVRAADLVGIGLIDRCYCEHRELFARAKSPIETVAIAQSEEWALALVAAGVGAAIVPEGVLDRTDGVAIREIRDLDLTRTVGLAYETTGALSGRLQALIEAIKSRNPRGRRRAASKTRLADASSRAASRPRCSWEGEPPPS